MLPKDLTKIIIDYKNDLEYEEIIDSFILVILFCNNVVRIIISKLHTSENNNLNQKDNLFQNI